MSQGDRLFDDLWRGLLCQEHDLRGRNQLANSPRSFNSRGRYPSGLGPVSVLVPSRRLPLRLILRRSLVSSVSPGDEDAVGPKILRRENPRKRRTRFVCDICSRLRTLQCLLDAEPMRRGLAKLGQNSRSPGCQYPAVLRRNTVRYFILRYLIVGRHKGKTSPRIVNPRTTASGTERPMLEIFPLNLRDPQPLEFASSASAISVL